MSRSCTRAGPDKLARTLGVSLASVAPSVWHGATGRAAHAHGGATSTVLTELELSRAAQKAVALAQQEKSTWTRADVIKYLGRVLPRSGMNPAAAAALLEDLADRALASEFEPVVCLEAPEPAEVPRSLLRADGRSVYQRHGGTRYATRAQLVMEERMLTQARASGAPRLTRAQAARALGADPAQLDDALTGRAPDAHAPRTRTGLRADQAAAALSVLTDGKRVSVINAPAGSGKTHVLTEGGKAWAAAGLGPVIGITAAQSARNTLAAGVPVSYNSAQFLGHLPGRRGARGPVETGPGPLLLVDEASTMPGPDLADLIAYAQARDGKLILAGDTSQLQAVENGGGMSLLADALGYARLAEPVRFRAAWEQQASLRLRDGDTTVLADYDQHGRILGGDPEQMMDAAAAAYVALTADGTDTLLMAAEHALRRELSRRIRDDLIALGIVEAGPAVRIADGAQASPGDLITCTRNDHTLEAGEPGRTLANGDLLRIEAVTGGGLVVRRALDADPAHRGAAVDRPHFLVPTFQRRRTGVRGHRSCRPGPHGAHRPGGDHRDRGPPARLRRAVPRHRRQPTPTCSPPPPNAPTRCPARVLLPSWPATTRFMPNETAFVPRPPRPLRPARRWGCWPACWTATASSTRPPRPASRPSPTPTTWPCCTRSGPPRPPPPASSATATCSPPPCPPNTTAGPATRPDGCGAPCAAPNWPAWTPPRSSPTRSANGTWPAPATWPPSWTPGSATGSAPWSRSRPGHGPRRSPPSPTPNATPTSPRSPP